MPQARHAKGRTAKDKPTLTMELTSAEHTYQQPGRYTVAVKVIDNFGNDTITLLPLSTG